MYVYIPVCKMFEREEGEKKLSKGLNPRREKKVGAFVLIKVRFGVFPL